MIVFALASWVALSVAFRLVLLTYVVVASVPSNRTRELLTKPVPVSVTAVALAPAVALDGERTLTVGDGFTTLTVRGELTPPPGDGFVTDTGNAPVVVSAVEGTDAVNFVDETYVVAMSLPLKLTFEPVTNPTPSIDSAVVEAPTVIEVGVHFESVTFGLVIVNAIDDEAPPPGAGFDTVTGTLPAFVSAVSGTVTRTLSTATIVGVSASVPKLTIADSEKPEPLMRSERPVPVVLVAASVLDGLNAVSVGVGLSTANVTTLLRTSPDVVLGVLTVTLRVVAFLSALAGMAVVRRAGVS